LFSNDLLQQILTFTMPNKTVNVNSISYFTSKTNC